MEASYDNANSDMSPVEEIGSTMYSIQNTTNLDSNKRHKEGRKKHANRPLIITLIVLGIIAIGLVISIIIVGSINRQTDEEKTAAAPNNDCLELNDSIEIGQCIQNTFRKDGNINDLISSYGVAIKTSIDNEDFDSVVEMINDRLMFLSSIGECETAMRLLSNMCTSSLDNTSLFLIYSDAISISRGCGDEDSVRKYSTLRKQLDFGEEKNIEENQ